MWVDIYFLALSLCNLSNINMQTNGGFLKWWYPTTIGFPTKNDHFGVEIGGTTLLRKHPNISVYIHSQFLITVDSGLCNCLQFLSTSKLSSNHDISLLVSHLTRNRGEVIEMLEFERQLRISERFKPLEHHFIHVHRLLLRFRHKIVQHIPVALFQSSISPIFKSPKISPKHMPNKNQVRGKPNKNYPHLATNKQTNSTWHSRFSCCFSWITSARAY